MFRRTVSVLLAACLLVLGAPMSPVSPAAAVPVESGTVTSNLRCVTFVDSTTGYAAGASGTIIKTTDAGASWRVVRSGDAYDFRGVSFSDASHGWVVSLTGQVLKTTDAGETWTLVSDDLFGPSYVVDRTYDLDFVSNTTGFGVGGAQGTPPMAARTVNAGSFWDVPLDFLLGSYDPPETQPPFPKDGLGYLYGVEARSSTKVWVCGQDVFKTPTISVIWVWNGTAWTRQTVTGTGKMLDISFGTDLAGIAVGEGGMARYTLNGGTSWIASTTGLTTEIAGVDLGADGTGWAVGYSGKILRTDNNGATWTNQTSGTTGYLEDVAVLGPNKAVAVGWNGTVVRTVDGTTWTSPVAAPVVSWLESTSHPLGEWVSDPSVDLAWSATGAVDGYGLVFDQTESTTPAVVNTTATSATRSATSGVWYAHVAAHDSLGRWSAPKHRQVLVDVTKPSVSDDVDPAGYTSAGTVTLAATDAHAGVASISYAVDGGSTTIVPASSAQVPFSTVGTYTLTYSALDAAGNVSDPGMATVVVRAPAAPVMTSLVSSSHPAGQWGSSASVSLDWGATGTGITGYGLVFDKNASTVVSTQSTTNTSGTGTATETGVWYAHVAAQDSYGQWSPTRHLQVLVDLTKPLVSDDADPLGYEGTANVNLSATDANSGVASISYRIDGGAPTVVAGSSAVVTRSTPGTYSLTYTALDNAGNVSDQGSATIVVRELPPPAAPVMTSLGSASHPVGVWTASTSVSLAWSATGTGIAGFGLTFDQLPSTTVAIQTTTGTTGSGTATGSGAWYAHVAAVDSLAQWSSTRHAQVLVDVTKPSVSDDVDPAGYTSAGTVTLAATDAHAGVASISYAVDGGSTTIVPASSAQVPFSTVGTYTLTYSALDAAGNVSDPGMATVVVRAPAAPVMTSLVSSSHPAGQWGSSASVSLDWGATGTGITGYGLVFDKNASTVVSTQSTTNTSGTGTATETGVWYAHVAAQDSYGQWSPTRHLQVLVDLTKPLVSDDADPLGYEGTANVNLSATDANSGVASISYRIDGGAPTVVAGSSAVVTRSTPGTYSLTYTALDNAGNVSDQGSATIVVRAIAQPAVRVDIEGVDRYTTAIEACDKAFGTGKMPVGPDGHRTVVIASGQNWPDALAASGLAGAYQAPLLLTRKDALPAIVRDRITSLGADRAFIIGGTAAVTDVVKSEIDAVLPGSSSAIVRLDGATRYATAVNVASRATSAPGRAAWDGTAFVATGANFPDALAAGPLAAANGIPLYLAAPAGIDAATLDAMVAAGVQRVYILGGTSAVSVATASALGARGIAVSDRWAGTNRYATAAIVAENSLLMGLDSSVPALAVGTNYPDALAGGVMQGRAGSVVLLTVGTSLSAEAGEFLSTNRSQVSEVRFLGGTAALSTSVRNAAMAVVTAP